VLGPYTLVKNPYAPPEATLGPQRQRSVRVANATVAAASAFIFIPLGLALTFYLYEVPLHWPRHTFPQLFKPLAFLSLGSIVAGAATLPFRNIRWYLAAIIGPLISGAFIVGLALLISAGDAGALD